MIDARTTSDSFSVHFRECRSKWVRSAANRGRRVTRLQMSQMFESTLGRAIQLGAKRQISAIRITRGRQAAARCGVLVGAASLELGLGVELVLRRRRLQRGGRGRRSAGGDRQREGQRETKTNNLGHIDSSAN